MGSRGVRTIGRVRLRGSHRRRKHRGDRPQPGCHRAHRRHPANANFDRSIGQVRAVALALHALPGSDESARAERSRRELLAFLALLVLILLVLALALFALGLGTCGLRLRRRRGSLRRRRSLRPFLRRRLRRRGSLRRRRSLRPFLRRRLRRRRSLRWPALALPHRTFLRRLWRLRTLRWPALALAHRTLLRRLRHLRALRRRSALAFARRTFLRRLRRLRALWRRTSRAGTLGPRSLASAFLAQRLWSNRRRDDFDFGFSRARGCHTLHLFGFERLARLRGEQ